MGVARGLQIDLGDGSKLARFGFVLLLIEMACFFAFYLHSMLGSASLRLVSPSPWEDLAAWAERAMQRLISNDHVLRVSDISDAPVRRTYAPSVTGRAIPLNSSMSDYPSLVPAVPHPASQSVRCTSHVQQPHTSHASLEQKTPPPGSCLIPPLLTQFGGISSSPQCYVKGRSSYQFYAEDRVPVPVFGLAYTWEKKKKL